MKSNNFKILTINGGSSSIKFALFEAEDTDLKSILKGKIEKIGHPDAIFQVNGTNPCDNFLKSLNLPNYAKAVEFMMEWVKELRKRENFKAVGHRVVHGGPNYSQPERIDLKIIEELHKFSPFDPKHLPEEILLIETFYREFPQLFQVACFDTAFHSNLPTVARLLPIPRHYETEGVRRYGFHGLSYEYLIKELAKEAGDDTARGRVILTHLGSGASLAAVKDGKSFDTSMSFTPNSGILMGTRSGDLDPGLFPYLSHTEGLSLKQFNEMVNSKSGLLGISETSSDVRELLKYESQNIKAADAIALFCYQVKKWIGGFAAALGGLDTLVFSGGIGENSSIIRARICEGLEFLGLQLEEEQNGINAKIISSQSSQVTVRVIFTNEEWIIANSVRCILNKNQEV